MSNELVQKTKNFIAMIEPKLSEVIPKEDLAKFMKWASIAMSDNPKLAACDIASLSACLMQCANHGLMPDKRHAYLIPYGTTCTFIMGYMGLIQVLYRTNKVKRIFAEAVHELDDYRYEDGQSFHSVPNPFGNRGAVIGYFAKCELTTGANICAQMSLEEVEKIKASSKGKNAAPWTQHFGEMGKKTVVRRLCKMLPFESGIQDFLAKEDAQENEKESFSSLLDGEEPINTTATTSNQEAPEF